MRCADGAYFDRICRQVSARSPRRSRRRFSSEGIASLLRSRASRPTWRSRRQIGCESCRCMASAASEFDRDKIVEVIRQAAKPASVREREARHPIRVLLSRPPQRSPLPVIFVQLNDKEHSIYYIDPRTARILQSYNSNSRWNRWLYHGLHSIDLPWLYKHRPAWDIVVLTLLLGGTIAVRDFPAARVASLAAEALLAARLASLRMTTRRKNRKQQIPRLRSG